MSTRLPEERARSEADRCAMPYMSKTSYQEYLYFDSCGQSDHKNTVKECSSGNETAQQEEEA